MPRNVQPFASASMHTARPQEVRGTTGRELRHSLTRNAMNAGRASQGRVSSASTVSPMSAGPSERERRVGRGGRTAAAQTEVAEREHEGERREVDPEDEAPADRARQERADRWPDQRRDAPDRRVEPERVRLQSVRHVERPEHRRHGQQKAAAEALHEPRDGDHGERRGRAADHRADGEGRGADEERPPGARSIGQRSSDRLPGHLCDGVGGRREREPVDAAEIARRARERRDDEQQIERGEEARAEASEHERAPARRQELAVGRPQHRLVDHPDGAYCPGTSRRARRRPRARRRRRSSDAR